MYVLIILAIELIQEHNNIIPACIEFQFIRLALIIVVPTFNLMTDNFLGRRGGSSE